ncbi:SIR2 family NAD-dependent protein deacylase [Viridibacillus sp. NPDC093762]|uniref:SIR2 family NAD-dependent protein deacylase n=1 Tax=Viridibacillus sp. NPDC093762 TaxID=3390720 RepID=UPI003D0938B1
MSIKNIDEFFQEKLTMYPHLKVIRDNLWSKDGKSRVSVMVGAGYSLNANKIEENFSGIALWNDLKKMLTENLNHHLDIEYKDVLEIGQLYEEEYGRASLDEVLKEAIPDDNYEPDSLHYKLLNLPWADIYTTNYDTLLERAKRNVYERNYQVIYDVNDIPNSTSPRIIKLHGSFPSNRPFIFTENDYESYPKRFSPFVNMVQQSIMETTFVLVGFSGDDPNFERWTTWVRNNLGDQMPKIYMIGYGQRSRQGYLKSIGVTLIDFEEIYSLEKNPYKEMFTDLFEFLSYKNREEKTKWPYKAYRKIKLSLEDLQYNRESFPGWVVMPDDIRRSNAESIRFFANKKINSIATLKNGTDFKYLNELLWCYDQFYIPLVSETHKKLKDLIEEIGNDLDNNFNNILLVLLKEARLDCNKEEFYKYKDLLENTESKKLHRHRIIHEELLFNLAFNNIDKVEEKLNVWQVGEKEIEWGIKKAAILIKISRKEAAKEILEEYLQTIRNLLAIQSDEYRLLSLESIALSLLKKINNERDYGYDRLRNLNLKNCNVGKEFYNMLISVKKYEYTLGTKETPGFDPGKGKISSSMGDYFKQELLDSYAILQIEELFNLTISDRFQYELSLKNLEIQYPLYSQIKRIQHVTVKKMDEFFSREFVYKLDENNLKILVEMLKDTIKQETTSIINVDVALEIISRIYFALSQETKQDIDLKIISFINNEDNFKDNVKNILENLIERLMFDKNKEEQKLFCEQLIESNIFSQWNTDKSLYMHEFFEPLLVPFSKRKDICNLVISENKILEMLRYIKEGVDRSKKESALIRMTFLEETKSLSETIRNEFIEVIKELKKNSEQGISDFIFNAVFDKIINSKSEISENGIEFFLSKEIPTFYNYNKGFKGFTLSSNVAVYDYYNELYGIFPDYIGKQKRKIPDSRFYKEWLNKFYKWWDSQEKGLLRDIKEDNGFLYVRDYLKTAVLGLKNNILSVVPIDALDDRDIEKIKEIFNKIDESRPDLSLYLFPSFERLKIPTNYSLMDIVNCLKSKDQSKVDVATHCTYDYLVLINSKEILGDGDALKKELFNMLHYGSDEIFKNAADTLKYCMKNIPSIFSENECKLLLEFLNDFISLIKKEKIIISTLKNFEVLSSVVALAVYLYQNQTLSTKENFDEWDEFIKNHRLPEIRKYRDLLIGN